MLAREDLSKHMKQLTAALLGRIPAAERRTQGGVFLSLVAICRIARSNWTLVADAARINQIGAVLEEKIHGLAREIEHKHSQLDSSLTEYLLVRSSMERHTLPRWIIEIDREKDLIQSSDQQEFSRWFSDAIDEMSFTASGPSYTPSVLASLMAKMLGSEKCGSLLDPYCRTGELLKAAVENTSCRNLYLTSIGLTSVGMEAALARLRFLFTEENINILDVDGLRDPLPSSDYYSRFDEIICDVPFGRRIDAIELASQNSMYWLSSDLKSVSIESAYINLIFQRLKPNGRAVARVSPGFLFRSGADALLRRALIDRGHIAAVIGLPGGLVPGSAIQSAILIMDRSKPEQRGGRMLMVDASETRITDERWIDKVYSLADHDARIETGLSRWVTPQEIAERDFHLQPRAYLQQKTISSEIAADVSMLEEARLLEIKANKTVDEMDKFLSSWIYKI